MAIIQSVKPYFVGLIAEGKKFIELRKSEPKAYIPPFKVYIYCTKTGNFLARRNSIINQYMRNKYGGKVVGEYICKNIYEYDMFPNEYGIYDILDDDREKICLSMDEIWTYGMGKRLYGYEISDVRIYDEPKYLCEFESKGFPLRKPPQSWCYVKELV